MNIFLIIIIVVVSFWLGLGVGWKQAKSTFEPYISALERHEDNLVRRIHQLEERTRR